MTAEGCRIMHNFICCEKCIGMLCLSMQSDLSVPDVPKTIAWCQDSLCVGFKRDYYLIKVLLIRSLSANSHTYCYLVFHHPLTLSFQA